MLLAGPAGSMSKQGVAAPAPAETARPARRPPARRATVQDLRLELGDVLGPSNGAPAQQASPTWRSPGGAGGNPTSPPPAAVQASPSASGLGPGATLPAFHSQPAGGGGSGSGGGGGGTSDAGASAEGSGIRSKIIKIISLQRGKQAGSHRSSVPSRHAAQVGYTGALLAHHAWRCMRAVDADWHGRLAMCTCVGTSFT